MFALKNTPFYPLILLLCLGITWGTSFSIAKFAMHSGITPLGYLFWQCVGPATLLTLILFCIQKKMFVFPQKQIFFYIFTSLFGILLPNYFMFVSAVHVPSGILGLIVNTSPVITYSLSLLFVIEKFHFTRFTGILLGVGGLALLLWPRTHFVTTSFFWLCFAFFVPFFLALSTIFIVKFKPAHTNSLELARGMLIFATFLIVPITLWRGEFHSILPMTFPNFIILLEILLSTLGFVLFFELLRISGPVYYSLVSCLVALSSFGWGYLIFHETLVGTEMLAVLLTVFALYLVSTTESNMST